MPTLEDILMRCTDLSQAVDILGPSYEPNKRRTVGRQVADYGNYVHSASSHDLPFLPTVRARVAPMLGCLELAMELAFEESRQDLDAAEVANDIMSFRKKIASYWYERSLSRRCHCNCTVAQCLHVCTGLADGSCDNVGNEVFKKDGWRPGPEEILQIKIGDGLCRKVPRLDIYKLLDATDREVTEEILDYGEEDKDLIFGIAPRGSFDSSVSWAADRLMEGFAESVNIDHSYKLSLWVDKGHGNVSVLDANGDAFASVSHIPMETTVVRSVARGIAEAPKIWPWSVTYSELFDASTRLLDADGPGQLANQRSRDAFLEFKI